MDEHIEAALMQAGHQIEQLQRQVAALRKDAERYRWLRDFAEIEVEYEHQEDECGMTLHFHCEWDKDPELDDAVDAAMAREPER